MIFIKKIYLILLLWVLIILGVLVFVFGTNMGTNLVFNILTYYIPEITYESVSGNWGNFNFVNLTYKLSSSIINVDSLCISINLRYFLFKQINIEHLFLKNFFIKINNSHYVNGNINNVQKHIIPNIFKSFHVVIIKNIIFDDVYILFNNIEFRCQKVNSGLILCDGLLKILPTYMVRGSIFSKLSADILHDNKLDIKTIFIEFYSKYLLNIKSIYESFIHNILIIFSKYKIPIDLVLTDIKVEQLHVYDNCRETACYIINYFQMQAYWNIEVVNVKFRIDSPYGCLNSTGNIILNDYYPIDVVVDYIVNNISEYNHGFDLKSNIKNIKLIITGSLIDEIYVRCNFLNFISVVHILLTIRLKDLGIPIELCVTGKLIPISLYKKNKYILESFYLHLTGKLCDKYFITIRSKITNVDIGSVYMSVCAAGNLNKFVISKLKIKMLNGCCEMNGVINWEKSFNWSNVYIFNNISFLKEYFKCPIILSGKIVTHGYLSKDTWEITISDFYCNGYFKNKKIICRGAMCIGSKKQLNIPIFFVNWGSNILEIQGNIQKDRTLNIILKLKIIDVIDFFPQFYSGVISANCKIYGFLIDPAISLKVNMRSLSWKNPNINIDYIIITSHLFYKNSIKNDFYLTINQIRYKNLFLNKLRVQGIGNLNKHSFNIIICDNQVSGIINGSGKFNLKYQVWNGQINKTRLFTSVGEWTLTQDIVFVYQNFLKKFTLKPHCWYNSNCQYFISNNIQKILLEKINTIFKNRYFNFSDLISIRSVHAHDVYISCTDINWVIGNSKLLCDGTIFIVSSQLAIQYIDYKNIPVIMTDNVIINLKLNQNSLSCDCVVNIDNNNNFIKFLISDLSTFDILGNIQIKNISLDKILQFSLRTKRFAQGVLNSDITFQGNLYNPKIYGVIQLKNLVVDESNFPLSVKNGLLEIECIGDHAIIRGIINTEYEGQLYCDGHINHINSICRISMLLNIRGHHININISPTIQSKISTNIVCTIIAEKINITGDIIVDSADIIISKLSSNIIEVSSEELILDKKHQPILDKAKEFSFFISAILNIYLGDNVNFIGLGLHAKLKGNLEMIYNHNDFSLIGHVNISSGYVELYGQNLIIKKGQLLFSGAINQTYLDIETIKDFTVFPYTKNSITTGMRISGLINQLRLDFISDSSLLSQQEIMHYFLGGDNSIFCNNVGDTNIITSLLIRVGVKRYEKLINKFGEVLGLHDLRLSTQDFGMPTLITLSGYIAPGLQIQYGINIFDLLTTITMRYCINSKLYLEANSSNQNQSLDLLYKFDFN